MNVEKELPPLLPVQRLIFEARWRDIERELMQDPHSTEALALLITGSDAAIQAHLWKQVEAFHRHGEKDTEDKGWSL